MPEIVFLLVSERYCHSCLNRRFMGLRDEHDFSKQTCTTPSLISPPVVGQAPLKEGDGTNCLKDSLCSFLRVLHLFV